MSAPTPVPELRCEVPDEPPEFSVVVPAHHTASVWQREDGWKADTREARWFPALYRIDSGGHGLHDPMRWSHLVAQYKHLVVLRWGTGEETS